ncbi:MAG: hypothetical protein ACKOEO_25355, partial [Planctomycetaceae bacterium]
KTTMTARMTMMMQTTAMTSVVGTAAGGSKFFAKNQAATLWNFISAIRRKVRGSDRFSPATPLNPLFFDIRFPPRLTPLYTSARPTDVSVAPFPPSSAQGRFA